MKTRNCYEIILNKTIFNDFVYNFLPELEKNQMYYLALLARQKYSSPRISLKESLVTSFVVSTKEDMVRQIKRLEIPSDNFGYVAKDGYTFLREDALALYVLLNPRDTRKATANLIKKSTDLFLTNSNFNRVSSSVISEIHKSPIKNKPFIIFDIDRKNQDDLDYVSENTNNFHKILETKNGYHIILKKEDISHFKSKFWYTNLTAISDNYGDIMIPIPGCRQGNFSPIFVN
jgi:hypothetical protein